MFLSIPSQENLAPPRGSRKRKLSDDEDDEDTSKRGRPKGAGNYTSEDVSALLDAMEKELPLGMKGYQAVHRQFTRWARLNSRPERTVKSLETKFQAGMSIPFQFSYVHLNNTYSSWSRRRSLRGMHTVHPRSNARISSTGLLLSVPTPAISVMPSLMAPTAKTLTRMMKLRVRAMTTNHSHNVPRNQTKPFARPLCAVPDPQAVPTRTSRHAGSELMSRLSEAFDPGGAASSRDQSCGPLDAEYPFPLALPTTPGCQHSCRRPSLADQRSPGLCPRS